MPAPTADAQGDGFDAESWTFDATKAEVGIHLGRRALELRGGFAFARDLDFRDGVLEFDMTAERGIAFAGVVWHVQSGETDYEKMYLRTFLSGSREATQYTPVANHVSGWQLYHGPGYNQPVVFNRGEWLHVKVVVSGDEAELFVRDMETPKFTVRQRLPHRDGRVGLIVEPIPEDMGPASVWFSNVRFTPTDAPTLKGRPEDESAAGAVPQWRVSRPFSAQMLPADGALPTVEGAWSVLDSEPSGLVNLAFAHPVTRKADTAMACTFVEADAVRRYRLRFGFSEHARVWWNGEPRFDGDELWHDRDITFQGVVGKWYALWLPARAGANELCFAVTENVGMRSGWGFVAAFDDVTGLSFAAQPPRSSEVVE